MRFFLFFFKKKQNTKIKYKIPNTLKMFGIFFVPLHPKFYITIFCKKKINKKNDH